jgi:hypothetical protein
VKRHKKIGGGKSDRMGDVWAVVTRDSLQGVFDLR